MRLDRFLSVTGTVSRSDAKRAVRGGQITVNGHGVKSSNTEIDPENDVICYLGKRITYRKYTYVMLNKPDGYVSATEDPREKTVLDLLPDDLRRIGLFPCGRLDKHTLGLMLLTDNGELAHRLLAPKRHVTKEYFFRSRGPISESEAEMFRQGLVLDDGYETKPAEIKLLDDRSSGVITLVEGKYHQIKRMLEALDNKIVYLERIRFGNLRIEDAPTRGEWRFLTDEERAALERLAE